IEDADKFPLRTLALWFDRVRWLPELKGWFHDDRLRAMVEGDDITGSVSSATRPPGKYKVKWDGKDNKGNLVKAGKYTVVTEAAGPHGALAAHLSLHDQLCHLALFRGHRPDGQS